MGAQGNGQEDGPTADNRVGMYYLPLVEAALFGAADPSVVDDIDFFEFPYFGNQRDAEKAVEAPVDAWFVPARSQTLPADLANATAFLEFWAKGSTQLLMYAHQPYFVPAAGDTDTASLDRLAGKALALVTGAGRITQTLYGDTRPGFAGNGGIDSFLRSFVNQPAEDLTLLTKQIQQYWDDLGPESGDQTLG